MLVQDKLREGFKEYLNDSKVVIFASGVSNSRETRRISFEREERLLKTIIESYYKKTIVYFGTCSVYDNSVNQTSYVQHKLKMEHLIENKCQKFYIFRLPQIVGQTSSPTLINHLFNAIYNDEELAINKNSTRNLIGVNEVFFIANYLIKNNFYVNETTNIATPYNDFVIDIIFMIEKILKKKCKYKLINIGEKETIDINKIMDIIKNKNIFPEGYTCKILNNFYRDFQLNNDNV